MSDSKNTINKILIVRLGAIGDVVHTTALFRALKKYNPDFSIHYLTTKTPSLLIQNDPDLDKVWIAEGKSYKYLIGLAKEIRREGIDLCINLQPSIRLKTFCLLTGAKKRLTYKKTFKLHAVENFWATAKPLLKDLELPEELKLYIPEAISNKASNMADENTIGFNIGISPTRQGRAWPIEYWEKLAEKLMSAYGYNIVLTGSEADKNIAEKLLDVSPKIKSFCGKLDILENAALLSRCKFIISGDTGPLHIATAIGTPTISLYGAAPISRTGPYGFNHFPINSERDCVPCNRRKCKFLNKGELYTPCMKDISPDNVLEVIKENLID